MILYHGSNVEVKNPKIILSKRYLDFGNGFYLTSDFEQAKKWATRSCKIREEGKALISEFEIENLNELDTLEFSEPNKEWLEFIVAHRTGNFIKDDYDVIIGPVANDQTIRTINDYIKGRFSQEIAIQLLLPQNLKDQYAFKTEKSLSTLHFIGVKEV